MKTLEVDLSTKHKSFDVPKWIYILIVIIFKGACLYFGYLIGKYLCSNCLFCKDCNPIVTTYLSIISLSCFVNIGLPIDKLANVSMSN